MTSHASLFNYGYLAYRWPIFAQISICCSSNNFFTRLWHLCSILMTSSWSKFRLKATLQKFSALRVISIRDDYFEKPESACQCSLSCISVIFARFSPKFQYVVAKTLGYRKCHLHFSIRRWDHVQIFVWKSKFGMDSDWDWVPCTKPMRTLIAQSVERLPHNVKIPGSSPAQGVHFFFVPLFLSGLM